MPRPTAAASMSRSNISIGTSNLGAAGSAFERGNFARSGDETCACASIGRLSIAIAARLLIMSEQADLAAGMNEHDGPVARKHTVAYGGDQSGHAFRAIDRIKNESFKRGRQAHRLSRLRRRRGIVGTRPLVAVDEVTGGDREIEP